LSYDVICIFITNVSKINETMTRATAKNRPSVLKFFSELIENFKSSLRLGTARNYSKAFRSFSSFLGGKDISFSDFDEGLIERYNVFLSGRKVSKNSMSFYNRILRAVYNKAVRQNLTLQSSPFSGVYTGVDETLKRAVGAEVIVRLQELDLGFSTPLSLSRDLFVFSFCTRGMAFIDIAYLRRENIGGGFISYRRQKTGQRLRIRMEPCMEEIIKRWEGSAPYYIFPLLSSRDERTAFRQYQTALGYHNKKLKVLSGMLCLGRPLTSYTPRHTWATIARNRRVPLSVISAALGHSSERTTRIYLDSIENSEIDEANRDLLRGVKCKVSL